MLQLSARFRRAKPPKQNRAYISRQPSSEIFGLRITNILNGDKPWLPRNYPAKICYITNANQLTGRNYANLWFQRFWPVEKWSILELKVEVCTCQIELDISRILGTKLGQLFLDLVWIVLIRAKMNVYLTLKHARKYFWTNTKYVKLFCLLSKWSNKFAEPEDGSCVAGSKRGLLDFRGKGKCQ